MIFGEVTVKGLYPDERKLSFGNGTILVEISAISKFNFPAYLEPLLKLTIFIFQFKIFPIKNTTLLNVISYLQLYRSYLHKVGRN